MLLFPTEWPLGGGATRMKAKHPTTGVFELARFFGYERKETPIEHQSEVKSLQIVLHHLENQHKASILRFIHQYK